jgi:hypothetical protein
MAGCAPIQFQDVTRARFNCLQQAASQQLNVILKGDSGSASDPGGTNTISWDFDEPTGILTLQATETPFPCFIVDSKIKSFVQSCP